MNEDGNYSIRMKKKYYINLRLNSANSCTDIFLKVIDCSNHKEGNRMRYEQINLEDLRIKNPSLKPKAPFEHQKEAFKALSETFTFPADQYKGGLLVLPTGAGKTYTAVNWICRNIISKKFKVLWFAQSSYLLNQAAKSFSSVIG